MQSQRGAHPGAWEETYRFPLHTPEIGPRNNSDYTLEINSKNWESAKVSHKRVFALLTPDIHSYGMAQML